MTTHYEGRSRMNEQWQELKETITEMRDNDGTGTQQEVCKFLTNLMDVLEKQMQEPKTGHWIEVTNSRGGHECDACHDYAPSFQSGNEYLSPFCPNCGAKMVEPQESEEG